MKKSKVPNPKAPVCEWLEKTPIKLPNRNSNVQQQMKSSQKPVAHVIPRRSNETTSSGAKNVQAASSMGSRPINQSQINSATTDFRSMNISNSKPIPTYNSQRVHSSQKPPTFKSQPPKLMPNNYKQPRPHIQNNFNITNKVTYVATNKKYHHQKQQRESNENSHLHKNKTQIPKSDGSPQNSGKTIKNQNKKTNKNCNTSKKGASNQSSTCVIVQNSSAGKNNNIIVLQQNAGTTVCAITNG